MNEDVEEQMELNDSGSIVLNHSENSTNIIQQGQIIVNYMQVHIPIVPLDQLYNVVFPRSVVYGPVLPPSLQWTRMFEKILPMVQPKMSTPLPTTCMSFITKMSLP